MPSAFVATLVASVFALSAPSVSAADKDKREEAPKAESEAEQDEKIVLSLSLTLPGSKQVMAVRQAVKTGESFEVPLGDGASLSVQTGEAKKKGKVHLGLAYQGADAEAKANTTEQDCDLPGEVNWSPVEGGPEVKISVRPHHKIKLVLDGDPLA